MIDFGKIDISEAYYGNIGLDSIWYGTIKVWPDGTPPVPPMPVGNTIIYSSTDHNVVIPHNIGSFDANIVSNTYYPDGDYGIIVFDDNVTRIGAYAFSGCYNLSSINMSDSVQFIGDRAFQNCNLSSVAIGSGTTSIGEEIFVNNTILSSITVDYRNTTYNDGGKSNCIIETASNKLIYGCKTTVIPNTVTEIGGYAFFICTGLSSITIPDSVIVIGDFAFNNCESLSSITMSGSLTRIGKNAFFSCTSLSSLTIPSVIVIEEQAFYDCTSLSSITIPDNLQTIDEYAFSYCTSLSSIVFSGTMAQWNSLTKGSNWHLNVPATVVHCSNGDVAI